jgi:hypothetical protein
MVFVTNDISPWDGVGSQFLTIIRAIIYSEMHGMNFVYTEPTWENIYSKEEASDLNKMLNIKGNYPDADPSTEIINRQDTYYFIDSNIDVCQQSPSMQRIKKLFFENNSSSFCDGFHVVIHIRRPSKNPNLDIPMTNTCGGEVKHITDFTIDQTDRFTSDGHFLNIIDSIRKKHSNAVFHICSDGRTELFANFVADDTILHINEPVTQTFRMMVFANILVTSKSTFSYTAALFNPNEIVYTRCWHSPETHWNKEFA